MEQININHIQFNPLLNENMSPTKFYTPYKEPQARVIIKNTIHQSINSKLEELIRLETGWDGYRAIAVSFQNARFADQIINSISTQITPAPQIVPGYSGDLQMEWHLKDYSLEVHVVEPFKVNAVKINNLTDEEEHISLTNDFEKLKEWMKQITESQIVTATIA